MKKKSSGGYLFIYFTGTEDSPLAEQLYLSISRDGLNWQDRNNHTPFLTSSLGEKGIRDPFILRKANGDGFVILATDLSIYHRGGWNNTDATVTGSHSMLIWHSLDLINWSGPKLIKVVDDSVGCVWAPEAIYDPKRKQYLVYWASPSTRPDHKMQILSSYTDDFSHFEKATVYIDNNNDQQDVIDTTIINANGTYVRASRDGHIRLEKATNLSGKWTQFATLQELGVGIKGDTIEGPEFAKMPDDHWCLYVDRFAEESGYLPVLSSDVTSSDSKKWQVADQFNFGQLKKRHGSILKVTESEYQLLKGKFFNER